MSDFIEEVIGAMNDIKDRHPIVYKVLAVPYFLAIGVPLVVCVLLKMLHSYVFRLDKKFGKKKVVFCFLPKFSDDGIIWLKKANREVYANADLISFYQWKHRKP